MRARRPAGVARPGGASRIAAAAVLAAALGLAGCGSVDLFAKGTPAGGYAANHPIAIVEAPVNLDIAVGMGSAGLSASERARIAAFAADARAHATTQLLVLRPANSANAAVALILAREAREIAISAGMPAHLVAVATYTAPDPSVAAPIRLTYSRMQATTAPCGAFTENVYSGFGNMTPYREFGCATQSNLAAMIADPADLVSPAAATPSGGL